MKNIGKALHVERNHKIHKIHQKALRAGLPAWRETTEHTEHTEKDCEKHCQRREKPQNTQNTLKEGLRKALPEGVSRCGVAASLSVVPQGAVSPCTAHEEPPLPREHQKSIRRMRSVQDSVLPEGRGGEASPHIPLIHSMRSLPPFCGEFASHQREKNILFVFNACFVLLFLI